MISKKIAVISDIHGNADSLGYVLDSIQRENIFLTVILGDLLTYGCQPKEVIDILVAYESEHPCVFIKGNHDQFYFDKDNGTTSENYKMPDFVKESVDWTADNIAGEKLGSIFEWHEHFIFENIYFAHANPYEYGNWEYVDSDEQHARSFSALSAKGYRCGVFGHSHRAKVKQFNSSGVVLSSEKSNIEIKKDTVTIINAGSIGQPRGTGLSYLLVTYTENTLFADIKEFTIDMTNSINLINNTNISSNAKEKLITYLRS